MMEMCEIFNKIIPSYAPEGIIDKTSNNWQWSISPVFVGHSLSLLGRSLQSEFPHSVKEATRNCIWVRSRECYCLVTWLLPGQSIEKPGNKTVASLWSDSCIWPVWILQPQTIITRSNKVKHNGVHILCDGIITWLCGFGWEMA